MNSPIVVLGATGKSGRRVAARLRLQGAEVRAASRSSEHPFDWDRPDGWDRVLAGAGAVYVVAPYVEGPVHDLVARAEALGVGRLVLLSGRGADTWGDATFGRDMVSAEQAVRASSLEWTIVRANNFDQNFDQDLFHAPLLAGELALPSTGVTEPFVDLEDVAEVAAHLLLHGGAGGQTVELTGPEAISFAEAVARIARAADRAITYRAVSIAEYVDLLVAAGWERPDAVTVADMFTIMDRGLMSGVTDDVARVLGRPARSFDDYVARHAAAGVWDA